MELRILCVHGIGQHPSGGSWEGAWRNSITEPIQRIDGDVVPLVEFVYLDDIFAKYPISAADVAEAIWKLAKSGAGAPFRQARGIGDQIRWTAGMVVQWVENSQLRVESRKALETRLAEFDAAIVVGHSLGSLVCYDLFSSKPALMKKRRFVSCGSQIGNPFVVGNFAAGKLTPIVDAIYWYHLYNAEDDVFTAQLRLPAPNFSQIETFFDIQGFADHDVTEYMRHRRTVGTVWSDAVMALRGIEIPRTMPPPRTKTLSKDASRRGRQWAAKPRKRALLIGINEYPDPSNNLEGCVNDVFLMSSLLQESGFAAEDIRVVLNNRATRSGVIDRLEWLLDDAVAGDTRFLYYSGHGAQMPSYGLGDVVDSMDEALVLHDFDWTPERAFTDDDFFALYSQLPYELNFVSIFDCCHSGGMTRAGVHKARGIDPPDDIRHRMLRWDSRREMWIEREVEPANAAFDRKLNAGSSKKIRPTRRLGQAMDARTMTPTALKGAAAKRGHKGPYLPALVYASREEELSFEYKHGVEAFGAFTYCLVKTLRRDRRLKHPRLTFDALITEVAKELDVLGYEQEPRLVAPRSVRTAKVPLEA